jgi:hypothetical protein
MVSDISTGLLPPIPQEREKVLILYALRNTHYVIMKAVEIICRNCGADTLLKRDAVYDGFTKTGERLICSGCGFEYASEEDVPFKAQQVAPEVFTDADRSTKIEVFDEGENQILCRYCANYIVNPFTQFCALHKKEVQATDTCDQFERTAEKNDTDGVL